MTGAVKVYCYVRLQGARVSGFPELVDPANAIEATERLRLRLNAAIAEQGRAPIVHGHLYQLEVRDYLTDNLICNVEARP